MNAQPMHEEDYDDDPRGFFSKAKSWFFGDEDTEEFDQHEPQSDIEPQAPRRQQIRLHTARSGKVNVRKNAQVFEDAKAAADGLKNGEQQIINLERATPMMSEKIVDFLSGVCYALDGTSTKIGDKVFMFLPANVAVESDETTASSGHSTPARRAQYE